MRKLSRDPQPTARQAHEAYLEDLEADARELDALLGYDEDPEDKFHFVECYTYGHTFVIPWNSPLLDGHVVREAFRDIGIVVDCDICPICHPNRQIGNRPVYDAFLRLADSLRQHINA